MTARDTARLLLFAALASACAAAVALEAPNGGFEDRDKGHPFVRGWHVEIGKDTKAFVSVDEETKHSGKQAIRIADASPFQAFVFAAFRSDPIDAEPLTTYVTRFWARGKGAKHCYAAAGFEGDGERRQELPSGDFDWREIACTFTTPEHCKAITLRFASDDVTESLWIDDVSLERAPRQLANLEEKRYPKDFEGVFPRSKGRVAEHLVVYDASKDNEDTRLTLAALQGIVNRKDPCIYLINPTNPPGADEVWLRYMQEKGYTGSEERVASFKELLARFKNSIRGVVVYDPDLPGTVNAACMISSVEDALPVAPKQIEELGLPIVEDLRGRWTRNVEAYRYVYDQYWDKMSHHVLSWTYPRSGNACARDYMIEFKVFTFWLSGYADQERGADPPAEEAFIDELLANTPANVPVMGWPACGDTKGMQEYSGVRWLSEYGKFVPGTEFCSNLSVHSAIHPDDALFRQKEAAQTVELDTGKVCLSVSVLDSGDAIWYWQLHQRKIWADPARGSVPIGWCMNTTLYDTTPLVLQWYYENATPNDTFFAAVSGLGYMNTQVYASRFRAEDRERIWREYVRLTGMYCNRLDIHGIELYNGSWGEKTPPDAQTFRRYVDGIPGLDFIIADLGRHDMITPANADYRIGTTAVFHTLTRFQVWSSSDDVIRNDMGNANAWLLDEITRHAPATRPGFMSAMAISWYYYPSWFKDLQSKLPADYIMVSPATLARLFPR